MARHKNKQWKRSGRKNRHHIKNKCRGGTNDPKNIILLDTEKHKAFHFLFGNMDFLQAAALLQKAHSIKSHLSGV